MSATPLDGLPNRGNDTEGSPAEQPPARVKMILAAEHMFATHGIGAVSFRQIAVTAGQGNTNAVQYHFKSKGGLVQAIFLHRIGQMEGPRQKLLDEVEQRGLLNDARSLLEVLCLPQVDIRDEQGGHSYAKFMLQYHQSRQPPENSGEIIWRFPTLSRIFSLMLNRISYVPPDLARARISVCNLMFQDVLARMDDRSLLGLSFSKIVDDRLEIMTAALCAPFRPGQAGHGYLSEGFFGAASTEGL